MESVFLLGPSGNFLLDMVPRTLYAYGTTLEVGIRKEATGRSNHNQNAPVTATSNPVRGDGGVSRSWSQSECARQIGGIGRHQAVRRTLRRMSRARRVFAGPRKFVEPDRGRGAQGAVVGRHDAVHQWSGRSRANGARPEFVEFQHAGTTDKKKF